MAHGKKHQDRKATGGGGALTGMRAGMQRMAGGSGGKRSAKAEPNFVKVFGWVLGVALLLVAFYLIARR